MADLTIEEDGTEPGPWVPLREGLKVRRYNRTTVQVVRGLQDMMFFQVQGPTIAMDLLHLLQEPEWEKR